MTDKTCSCCSYDECKEHCGMCHTNLEMINFYNEEMK